MPKIPLNSAESRRQLFFGLLSNQAVLKDNAVSNREAVAIYQKFLQDDRVRFQSEPEGIETLWFQHAALETKSPHDMDGRIPRILCAPHRNAACYLRPRLHSLPGTRPPLTARCTSNAAMTIPFSLHLQLSTISPQPDFNHQLSAMGKPAALTLAYFDKPSSSQHHPTVPVVIKRAVFRFCPVGSGSL